MQFVEVISGDDYFRSPGEMEHVTNNTCVVCSLGKGTTASARSRGWSYPPDAREEKEEQCFQAMLGCGGFVCYLPLWPRRGDRDNRVEHEE